MKYALIGCGRISPNHIAAAKANQLDIVAICDIVPANMEDKRIKFELPASTKEYTDYMEMLEKEKPELVAIATESGKHAEIALNCIEAGCNIIIEKPIALSLEDADKIIAKGKEKNKHNNFSIVNMGGIRGNKLHNCYDNVHFRSYKIIEHINIGQCEPPRQNGKDKLVSNKNRVCTKIYPGNVYK